jgi:hypothetical protein
MGKTPDQCGAGIFGFENGLETLGLFVKGFVNALLELLKDRREGGIFGGNDRGV